jgi:hypothetical protein
LLAGQALAIGSVLAKLQEEKNQMPVIVFMSEVVGYFFCCKLQATSAANRNVREQAQPH